MKNTPLSVMTERAKLSANRDGRRVALVNLNPAGQSLWCIREWRAEYEGDNTVRAVDPDEVRS